MRKIKFPDGEPRYWYAEFDLRKKYLEICLDNKTIKIPQEVVMSWFMQGEYAKPYKEGKTYARSK